MLALQYTPLGLKRQNVISSHDQENQLYNPTLFFDVLKVCFFSKLILVKSAIFHDILYGIEVKRVNALLLVALSFSVN